jgi:hypothetical protein
MTETNNDVRARKSQHAADGDILVVDCPGCARRFGLAAPGEHACICGRQLRVTAYEGWKAPPVPAPAPAVLPPDLTT